MKKKININKNGFWNKILVILISSFFLFEFLGCNDQDKDSNDNNHSIDSNANNTVTPIIPTEQEISYNDYIKNLDPFKQLEESPIEKIDTRETSEDNYICQVDYYKGAPGFQEYMWLSSNTDVLYPGAMLDGPSVLEGSYAPVNLKRGPVTFTVNLPMIQGQISKTIEEAKYSSVMSSIHEILSQRMDGDSGAEINWDVEEIYSSSQLRQVIGLGVKVPELFNIDGAFEWGIGARYQRVVAKFTQKYYDIVVDSPELPSNFFHKSVTEIQVKTQLSETSPVYVSSVNYGRYALFFFESADLSINLKSQVEAYLNVEGVGAGVRNENEFNSMLSSTRVKAFILGGSGQDASKAITSFDQFREYIENGGSYSKDSPGRPISYNMRYLSNNRNARIILSTEYEKAVCSKASNRYRITIQSIGVDDIDNLELHDFGDGIGLELFGKIIITGGGWGNPTGGGTVWDKNGNWYSTGYYRIREGEERTINESTEITFDHLSTDERSKSYILIEHDIADVFTFNPFTGTPILVQPLDLPNKTTLYLDSIADGNHSIIIKESKLSHIVRIDYQIQGL